MAQKDSKRASTRNGSSGTGMEVPGDTLNRGDEAAPGTPGSGEDICPQCHGTGRVEGSRCPNCGGAGKITRAIGGA